MDSFPLNIGDKITIPVKKTGWRKLWAKLRGQPISEIKEFVITAKSTAQ